MRNKKRNSQISDPLTDRSITVKQVGIVIASKKTLTLPILWWQVDMKMSVRIRCSLGEEEEVVEMEKKEESAHP